MSIALIRYYNGEQDKEKIMMEIVSSTPPKQDPFLDLQLYLYNNRIKFVSEIPYSIGLFCSKKDDAFIVVNNSYMPDWETPDEKPPILSTYFYSLRWLKIPEQKEDYKYDKDKEIQEAKEQIALIASTLE